MVGRCAVSPPATLRHRQRGVKGPGPSGSAVATADKTLTGLTRSCAAEEWRSGLPSSGRVTDRQAVFGWAEVVMHATFSVGRHRGLSPSRSTGTTKRSTSTKLITRLTPTPLQKRCSISRRVD
jgi:hypothetical protein